MTTILDSERVEVAPSASVLSECEELIESVVVLKRMNDRGRETFSGQCRSPSLGGDSRLPKASSDAWRDTNFHPNSTANGPIKASSFVFTLHFWVCSDYPNISYSCYQIMVNRGGHRVEQQGCDDVVNA